MTGAKSYEILKSAIEHYGKEKQIVVAIEEFSEITKELCKYLRGGENRQHLIEEIADCYIMLKQLSFIFDIDKLEIANNMHNKLDRLLERIKK